MKKVLEMSFKNEAGKDVSLQISDPKDALTKSGVDKVMEDIVAKNIFTTKGGNLVKGVTAKMRVTDVTELA